VDDGQQRQAAGDQRLQRLGGQLRNGQHGRVGDERDHGFDGFNRLDRHERVDLDAGNDGQHRFNGRQRYDDDAAQRLDGLDLGIHGFDRIHGLDVGLHRLDGFVRDDRHDRHDRYEWHDRHEWHEWLYGFDRLDRLDRLNWFERLYGLDGLDGFHGHDRVDRVHVSLRGIHGDGQPERHDGIERDGNG